jgi:hypothetical protein
MGQRDARLMILYQKENIHFSMKYRGENVPEQLVLKTA